MPRHWHILIDQQGRVFRRFHHVGNPELEQDVQILLSGRYEARLVKVRL